MPRKQRVVFETVAVSELVERGLLREDSDDAAKLPSAAAKRGEGLARKSSVALVVDDEPNGAHTVAAVVAQYGFAVRSAYSAIEALWLANSTRPTLLLSNVALPTMNGMELAASVREFAPETQVIIFSRQAEMVNSVHDGRVGAHQMELSVKAPEPSAWLERLQNLGLSCRQVV